jgi:phage shock protein PspC (stress-responsive transcriptional regulator)
MNKVVTINLNGTAFQLEEAGYDALRAYLDGAARRLEGNPDKDEIIADIEQAIADKCRAALSAYKNVVVTEEVTRIIEEMGPVEDAGADAEESAAAAAGAGAARSQAQPPPSPVRRLYKIPEGAMLFGVCNGLGVYFGIDPTLVRLLFVLITFLWGFGVLVYLVMAIILPSPQSAAEKAAAFGWPATAQEFIRRARDGYYEGMRTLADRRAHRQWRRQFKREMRGWGRRLRDEARAHAYRAAAKAQASWTPGPPPGWTPAAPPPPWTPGAPAPFGLLILLPFVAMLRGLLAVAGFFAVISLLTTHTVFGVAPPEGMPLWVALILLLVIISLVAWPLKAVRHAWYWHAARGPFFVPPLFWALDAAIGIGCVVLVFWLVDRHVPQAHEALMAIPGVFQHFIDTVKQWWSAH